MMTPNTMRTTRPRLPWRIVSTRIPARQTMPRTEAQFQIRRSTTSLDLTASRRLSKTPLNAVTGRLSRRNLHLPARKPIAKDVAHVVPYLIDVEVVCEYGLADVGLEDAVFDGTDLESNATGCRVVVVWLAVGLVFGDDGLG